MAKIKVQALPMHPPTQDTSKHDTMSCLQSRTTCDSLGAKLLAVWASVLPQRTIDFPLVARSACSFSMLDKDSLGGLRTAAVETPVLQHPDFIHPAPFAAPLKGSSEWRSSAVRCAA